MPATVTTPEEVSVVTRVIVGAAGALLSTASTYSCVVSGLLLPAGSVAVTPIVPAGTSLADVAV